MKKLMLGVLFFGVLGWTAVLAQGEPSSHGHRALPPNVPPQELQHHPWMPHQPMLQHPAPDGLRACPVNPRCRHALGLLFLGCMVIHLLLAIWVYQDIRRRNTGSGIWIVVTLLAGLLGAAVYALVRLGDKQG